MNSIYSKGHNKYFFFRWSCFALLEPFAITSRAARLNLWVMVHMTWNYWQNAIFSSKYWYIILIWGVSHINQCRKTYWHWFWVNGLRGLKAVKKKALRNINDKKKGFIISVNKKFNKHSNPTERGVPHATSIGHFEIDLESMDHMKWDILKIAGYTWKLLIKMPHLHKKNINQKWKRHYYLI